MAHNFSTLGVNTILQKSLNDLEIEVPTEIQEKTIPVLLEQKKDFVGLAKTGTGKTLAFGIPLLQLIDIDKSQIQALVLAPTRELGQQIFENLKLYAQYMPEISIVAACGGIPIKPQIEQLSTETHILVATPGRLIDLHKRGALSLKNVTHFVLDEADEMIGSLKKGLDDVFSLLPKNKRTLLFTATMPGTIKQLIQNYMSKNIIQHSVDMETIGHTGIEHQYVIVEPIEKLDVLMHFLSSREGERGIIFCKTKAAVNKLAKNLAKHKFSSGALHGSLSQAIRDRIMEQFRQGYIDILVATDLAARGIDVKEVSYVVNYHLPDVYETYVHRSGRTARAGAKGFSLCIIQKEEAFEIPEFESELGLNFSVYQKANQEKIDENNALIWAKKVFKTKPNREVSADFKNKIHTVFHHLTKEELIEKLLADHLRGKTASTKVKKKK